MNFRYDERLIRKLNRTPTPRSCCRWTQLTSPGMYSPYLQTRVNLLGEQPLLLHRTVSITLKLFVNIIEIYWEVTTRFFFFFNYYLFLTLELDLQDCLRDRSWQKPPLVWAVSAHGTQPGWAQPPPCTLSPASFSPSPQSLLTTQVRFRSEKPAAQIKKAVCEPAC